MLRRQAQVPLCAESAMRARQEDRHEEDHEEELTSTVDAACADSRPQCWICLGEARRDTKLGTMRSPCACKGSMGYVHEQCLQDWVTSHSTDEVLPGVPSCPTCKERYTGDIVLLLAAGSALRLQLLLPRSAESRLITELQQRRMTKEAQALLRRSNKWNTWIADPTHPDTLQGFCNVAAAMCEVRQWEAAAILLRRVLRMCERLGGGRKRRGMRRAAWEAWALLPNALDAGQDARGLPRDDRHVREDDPEDFPDGWEEYEWSCVRAIARSAAEALADTLRRQGKFEEAEESIRRGKAFEREEWLVGMAKVWEDWVLPLVLLMIPAMIVFTFMFLICAFTGPLEGEIRTVVDYMDWPVP